LEPQGGSSGGRRGGDSCGYSVRGVSASASMCESPCYNAGKLNRCLVVSSSVSLGDLGDVTGGPDSELSVLKDLLKDSELSVLKDLSSVKAAGDSSTCVSDSTCVSLVLQPQPRELQPPLSCQEDTTALEKGGRELGRASKELARASKELARASCEVSCEALLQADDDDVIGAQNAIIKKMSVFMYVRYVSESVLMEYAICLRP